MDDEFDKRLKEYYRQMRENEDALQKISPQDKRVIKAIKIYNTRLRKSITQAKVLYDDFLEKLDEVMPEI